MTPSRLQTPPPGDALRNKKESVVIYRAYGSDTLGEKMILEAIMRPPGNHKRPAIIDVNTGRQISFQ